MEIQQNKTTLYEMIKDGENLLKNANKKDAKIDSILLAQHILGYNRTEIVLKYNEIIKNKTLDKYRELINLRCSGLPLQYITKEQEFMGLNFYVEPGVLIPRQDTETLIETIIEHSKHNDIKNIVEVGVGSGCISISLAKYLEDVSIVGIDISKKALQIATKNAKINKVEDKIDFIYGDLLTEYKQDKKIDLLVSNPPYIETKEYEKLEVEVLEYEPQIALDGGDDGLIFYRKITEQSVNILRKDGIIAYEIGYNQANEVEKILKDNGFKDIRLIKDLANRDRVIIGKLA